jgi:hypothetical protein
MRTVLAGHGLVLAGTLVLGAIGGIGCDKKEAGGGLPPATDWKAPAPEQAGAGSAGAKGPGDPHAGRGGAADPHAGLDMGAAGGNPHGAGGAGGSGVDVTALGLPAPDPDRKIDTSKYVKGTIKGTPITEPKMRAGGVIFLSVRKAGPDGKPSGAPIAVERLAVGAFPQTFELTEANAMIGGTGFTGDVVVMARYDQDSDAISKQPGDITGMVKATIPADKLTLVLDTVLP